MGLLTRFPWRLRAIAMASSLRGHPDERRGHHDIYLLLPVRLRPCRRLWAATLPGSSRRRGSGRRLHHAGVVTDLWKRHREADRQGRDDRLGFEPLGPRGICRGAAELRRARKQLLEPVAERIFFAGEALGGPLMQTCAGARLSGAAAASAAVRTLTISNLSNHQVPQRSHQRLVV